MTDLSFVTGTDTSEGDTAADPGDRQQWIPTVSPLPPGVHPNDPSIAFDPGTSPTDAHPDANNPVPHDTPGNRYSKGRKPWSQENDQALPVFQRGSHELAVGLAIVNQQNGGTALIVGRNKGRRQLRLWLPANVATNQLLLPSGAALIGTGVINTGILGCVVSAVEGELQVGGGIVINPGDPAITLEYEGSLYLGLLPGNTVGYCQWANMFNPPGGGLGGQ